MPLNDYRQSATASFEELSECWEHYGPEPVREATAIVQALRKLLAHA
jgi:hypothetical protein